LPIACCLLPILLPLGYGKTKSLLCSDKGYQLLAEALSLEEYQVTQL
jgi:hypothetical protein